MFASSVSNRFGFLSQTARVHNAPSTNASDDRDMLGKMHSFANECVCFKIHPECSDKEDGPVAMSQSSRLLASKWQNCEDRREEFGLQIIPQWETECGEVIGTARIDVPKDL